MLMKLMRAATNQIGDLHLQSHFTWIECISLDENSPPLYNDNSWKKAQEGIKSRETKFETDT